MRCESKQQSATHRRRHATITKQPLVNGHLALDVTHSGHVVLIATSELHKFNCDRLTGFDALRQPYVPKATVPQLPHALKPTNTFNRRANGGKSGRGSRTHSCDHRCGHRLLCGAC
jgi:hypothetical protein